MTDELKPVKCGCGGPTKIDYICIETYSHEHDCQVVEPVYRVFCKQCGISTPCAYPTEADAVTAWNRAMAGNVYPCTTPNGVYTSGCAITNTSSPNADFHPVRDCMVGTERTPKVDWINGEPYCPMCGDRLELE